MVKLVVQKRKARMGRNPATGEAIKIPAKTVVKARIAKQLKDTVLTAEVASAVPHTTDRTPGSGSGAATPVVAPPLVVSQAAAVVLARSRL